MEPKTGCVVWTVEDRTVQGETHLRLAPWRVVVGGGLMYALADSDGTVCFREWSHVHATKQAALDCRGFRAQAARQRGETVVEYDENDIPAS